ncbi:MAG: ABC transporter substrate-binding protein [Acidimicrobiales bacterium]
MTRCDRIATSRRPGSAPRRRIAGAARRRLVAVAAAAALAFSLSVTGTPAAAAQRGLAARAAVAAPRAVAVSTGRARGARPPDRIISLSPTATEMLFAIGAGRQVVAVDEDSDYPPAAPRTKLSGLDPNVEAIARYNPDLVVVSYDPEGFVKSLSALGVRVLLEPAATNLAGTYAQIESLGRVTGHERTAATLVRRMRAEIATAVAGAPRFASPPTYYYELEPDFYSVTSSTFVGRLLSMFGLRDIADTAQGASSGYPQLSDEYIVRADPQIIFLDDTICCHQSARTVAARPGWGAVTAVRDGDVVGLDDDIASRWGPRVVILARDIEVALWRIKRHRDG